MNKLYRWYDGVKEPQRFMILLGLIFILEIAIFMENVVACILVGILYIFLVLTRIRYLNKIGVKL